MRGALIQAHDRENSTAVTSSFGGSSEEVRHVDGPRDLERLTNQNGFAGFEYVGGD